MKTYLKTSVRKEQLFLMVCDALMVFLVFYGSYILRIVVYEGQDVSLLWQRVSGLVPLAVLIHLVVFYIFELYDTKVQKADAKQFLRIVLSVFLATGIIALSSYIFPHQKKIGRILITFHMILLISAIYLWRKIYFSSKSIGTYKKNFICVGSNQSIHKVASELQNSLLPEYTWVGTVTDYSDNPGTVVLNGTQIYPNLETLLKNKNVQSIVLSEYPKEAPRLAEDLIDLKFKGFEILDFPTFHQKLFGKVPVLKTRDSWLLYCHQQKCFQPQLYLKIKRLTDVTVSVAGLILSLPLFLLTALAIKVTSKGPIFFTQERLGLNEKPFTLIKFRTMVQDAEKDCGPRWSSANDPRITTVGKFLRKTRIDELPQLINILKGEMSFVGPRPIRRYFADLLSKEFPFYRLRFTVRPGVTGWAQVKGDYAGSKMGQLRKLEYELFYIQNRSSFFDLFIILKTIQTILFRPGE
jgi:exopolysaccharide biosynthesis polyprenyl glycosylphosphotransferase